MCNVFLNTLNFDNIFLSRFFPCLSFLSSVLLWWSIIHSYMPVSVTSIMVTCWLFLSFLDFIVYFFVVFCWNKVFVHLHFVFCPHIGSNASIKYLVNWLSSTANPRWLQLLCSCNPVKYKDVKLQFNMVVADNHSTILLPKTLVLSELTFSVC